MITTSPFKPAWFLRNRHLQTIVPNLLRPALPILEAERLELGDGDFIDLLWSQTRAPQTLLILHGLEGSIHSPYSMRMMNYCNTQGIAAVFMQFRGCSGEPNRLLRSYHSGETDDLRQVITHLKSSGITDIALLGYSLGGNQVVKYMGEAATDAAVRCAAAISVPLQLGICADTMDRGFAKIYQTTLLRRLVRKMQVKKSLLAQSEIEFPDPARMRNFRQFDDHFTAPIHGYDNAEHYYQSASSRQFLDGIVKPALIIQSRDDPFMTPAVLPDANELPSSVTLELSAGGGHVGYIAARGLKPCPWIETRVHSFLTEQGFLT